jgi:hypothetical protein
MRILCAVAMARMSAGSAASHECPVVQDMVVGVIAMTRG